MSSHPSAYGTITFSGATLPITKMEFTPQRSSAKAQDDSLADTLANIVADLRKLIARPDSHAYNFAYSSRTDYVAAASLLEIAERLEQVDQANIVTHDGKPVRLEAKSPYEAFKEDHKAMVDLKAKNQEWVEAIQAMTVERDEAMARTDQTFGSQQMTPRHLRLTLTASDVLKGEPLTVHVPLGETDGEARAGMKVKERLEDLIERVRVAESGSKEWHRIAKCQGHDLSNLTRDYAKAREEIDALKARLAEVENKDRMDRQRSSILRQGGIIRRQASRINLLTQQVRATEKDRDYWKKVASNNLCRTEQLHLKLCDVTRERDSLRTELAQQSNECVQVKQNEARAYGWIAGIADDLNVSMSGQPESVVKAIKARIASIEEDKDTLTTRLDRWQGRYEVAARDVLKAYGQIGDIARQLGWAGGEPVGGLPGVIHHAIAHQAESVQRLTRDNETLRGIIIERDDRHAKEVRRLIDSLIPKPSFLQRIFSFRLFKRTNESR